MADLVLLRSFPHAALARLAAHHLESHGVPAFLDGDSAIGAIGVDAVSVRLLVKRDDAARGRSLLERGTLDESDLDDHAADRAAEASAQLDDVDLGHTRPSSPAAATASPAGTSTRPLGSALAIAGLGLGLGVALVALVDAQREIARLEAAVERSYARCDVDSEPTRTFLEGPRAFVAP